VLKLKKHMKNIEGNFFYRNRPYIGRREERLPKRMSMPSQIPTAVVAGLDSTMHTKISVPSQMQIGGVVGGVGGATAQSSVVQSVGQIDANIVKAKREQMKSIRNQVLFDSPAIKVTYGNITLSTKNKSWCCYLGKCLPCLAPLEEKIITSKDFGTASSIKLTEVMRFCKRLMICAAY
jgi:hypothetical protein